MTACLSLLQESVPLLVSVALAGGTALSMRNIDKKRQDSTSSDCHECHDARVDLCMQTLHPRVVMHELHTVQRHTQLTGIARRACTSIYHTVRLASAARAYLLLRHITSSTMQTLATPSAQRTCCRHCEGLPTELVLLMIGSTVCKCPLDCACTTRYVRP